MNTIDAAELRRRAEARLQGRPRDEELASADQARRLLHELQVHQIELEIQNEELLRTRGELEAAIANYTDLYEFAPIGYLTLTREGAITSSNLAGARVLETQRAQLLNRHFREFVAAAGWDMFDTFLLKTFTSESTASCEVELQRLADPRVFVRLEASSLPDKQSCRLAVIDVSARVQVEATLRESNALNESLLKSIPFGMDIVDEQGRLLFLNRVLADAVGRPALGQTCWEVYKDDRRQCDSCPLKLSLQMGETRMLRSTGVLGGRTFEVTHTAMMFQGRRAMLEIFVDVTARTEAEHRLRRQAALLDAANDAIYVRDLDDRVTSWNRGAERLYGWTEAEALGRRITDLGDSQPAEFAAALAALRQRGSWLGELKKKTKAGRELTVFCRWTLLRDSEGRPTEVLAINSDITEQKLLEARFLRAQRMENIGTLASGVAHDLNNILAPILLTAPLLRTTLPDPEHRALLDMIANSAQRGAAITRQLLTFARGQPEARVPLPIRCLVQEMHTIAGETFPRNIRMHIEVPPDLWPVLADATQIHQALMNLCVNARDAMPNGGVLSIAVANVTVDESNLNLAPEARPGHFLCFRVSDTGVGILPKNLERIFDPFFTTKEVGKGTGLGLAAVMGIMRGHQGFVRVLTEVGVGSIFELYLPATPISTEAGATTAAPAALPPQGNGELILVVDDEWMLSRTLQLVLQQYGYKVLTAADGKEALAVFGEHRTEIKGVVTDMMMTGLDGPSLIRSLRGLAPNLVIVGMTGLIDQDGIRRLSKSDLPVLLAKPFAPIALVEVLGAELCKVAGPQ